MASCGIKRACALLCLCALSAPAAAQLQRDLGGAILPGASFVAPSDAWSVARNPAALGWAREGEAIATGGVFEEALHLSLYGSYRFSWLPLGIGIGGEHVRQSAEQHQTSLSLALGWAWDRSLAIGGALRYRLQTDALDAAADGAEFAVDLSLAWRPDRRIGLVLNARDLLGPVRLSASERALPVRMELAAQVRPWSDERFFVEAAGVLTTDGNASAGLLLSGRVRNLGRVWARLSGAIAPDPLSEVVLSAGIDVDLGYAGVTGAYLGRLDENISGGMAAIRLSHRPHRGVPAAGYTEEIEVRSLGTRALLATLLRLDRARREPEVRAVLLRMRGGAISSAAAQEMREAIRALQAAGKEVVCALESASGGEIYLCSAADQTFIDPAGSARLLGPSMDVMLFGDALHSLGVRADFVRIGEFKSAVEQYVNSTNSAAADRQRDGFLDDLYARYLEELSADRAVPIETMERWVDQGPYVAEEYAALGFAELLDRHFQASALTRLNLPQVRAPRSYVPDHFATPRRVALLVIDGAIVDGENVDVPILEIHQSGGQTIVGAIDALAADPTVAAIVVRIDSPGGSALASDQIWRALRLARRHKPVIASLGPIAASGGYYIASACDAIYADPATLTGSIGIFFGKVDFEPLAQQLGVGITQFGRGDRAGMDSLFRPFTPEERAVLTDKIRYFYRLFLQRVADGRGMEIAAVDAIARGRIWSGDAAQSLGLVDHLGGTLAALDAARSRANLRPDAEIVMLPSRPQTLMDYITGAVGLSALSAESESPEAADTGVADTGSGALGSDVQTPLLRHALTFAGVLTRTDPDAALALLPAHIVVQ